MATSARIFTPAPRPVPKPKAPIPVPPPPSRTTRTAAAVSRRLAPAVRMGAASNSAESLPGAATGVCGGQPLAPAVRMAIEGSFQADMSGVRVHSDARAQRAAAGLSARAFTHGNNIVLGRGQNSGDWGL